MHRKVTIMQFFFFFLHLDSMIINNAFLHSAYLHTHPYIFHILCLQCKCRPGYTGRNCGEEINECLSSPCENGGKCIDVVAGYNCQCPRGYYGPRCQSDVNGKQLFVDNSIFDKNFVKSKYNSVFNQKVREIKIISYSYFYFFRVCRKSLSKWWKLRKWLQ